MIKYTLKCAEGHGFESWFRDSTAFDTLAGAKQLTCTICGTNDVRKAVMAPAVSGPAPSSDDKTPLSKPASPAEVALRQLREHLQANSDYVGKDFSNEARRIHEGEGEARAIWGEATVEDARALRDDGVPVAPIPWMSKRDD